MSYRVGGFVLLVYQKLFDMVERRVNERGDKTVILLFGRVFRGCTPAFAEPYRIDRTGDLGSWLSAWIYAATLVQCFLLTVALTWLNGTLWSVAGRSVEFFEDRWNMVLYIVVCPMYVTLCIRMILLSMERDEVVDRVVDQACGSTQARRLFLCLFLISLLSSVLITNYVHDALNPGVVEFNYWFVQDVSGYRHLNSAGLYYIVLNFCLLFITFLGGASFISISIDGIRLSRSLLDSGITIDFKTYKKRLDRLVVAYFWGVLLVACYAINIIIWKHSPLGATATNLNVAGAMLTLVGIFFVTVPRRFIEHAWSSYCARKARDGGDEEPVEHQDMLSPERNRIIGVINTLVVVGWLPNFYRFEEYLDPYQWFQYFFKA